jgi:hypothetical protein
MVDLDSAADVDPSLTLTLTFHLARLIEGDPIVKVKRRRMCGAGASGIAMNDESAGYGR